MAETMAAAGHADASRWLHYGLTSNDVVDTAQALLLKEASAILITGVERLQRGTANAGRSNSGMPSRSAALTECTPSRSHSDSRSPCGSTKAAATLQRLHAAAEEIRVGKISGAVGTFGHIGPAAEERICERLGLRAAPIASQVISRDRHAHYVAVLALIAALCEKIALEIRHLQRTEVREAEEPFSSFAEGQFRDAPQAESSYQRADLRPRPRGPIECTGGV